MTNEIVKLSYEHTSNLNILNISTDKIYSRGYKQILKPDVKSDFQYLINSISCLIIIDIDNDQILKHIVNNDKVTFYYVYKEIPKTLANHSNIYNYNKTDFNLTSFIKDNNIEGALELEGKIKNYREKSSITLVQTIGLQDLHHMFKQIINIGDIQLRVLANINFIEMNLRYYYFINLSILNIKEELFNTVSMGLIIGKIREHFKSNFSSFEKTLDDENHEMWKSALNDIGYKEKLPKKLNFFSILNIAVYIRNKTLGHGSVTSISIDLLYIIDSIAILIHNEFSTQFSSIYFYYKHESVNSILNEISHKNIKIEVDEGFRYNRNTYKTPYIKISEGFIYVFDGVKNNEFEYINYINGKRIKPDLKRLSEFNS